MDYRAFIFKNPGWVAAGILWAFVCIAPMAVWIARTSIDLWASAEVHDRKTWIHTKRDRWLGYFCALLYLSFLCLASYYHAVLPTQLESYIFSAMSFGFAAASIYWQCWLIWKLVSRIDREHRLRAIKFGMIMLACNILGMPFTYFFVMAVGSILRSA